MAVLIVVLAPLGIYFINYIVTTIYLIITIQQVFDREIDRTVEGTNLVEGDTSSGENPTNARNNENEPTQSTASDNEPDTSNCECNENSIYTQIKNIREKIDISEQL